MMAFARDVLIFLTVVEAFLIVVAGFVVGAAVYFDRVKFIDKLAQAAACVVAGTLIADVLLFLASLLLS